MVRAEHALADGERPFVKGTSRWIIARLLQELTQRVEARRGAGVIGPEDALADRERALEGGARTREVALAERQVAKPMERRGSAQLVSGSFADLERALEMLARSGAVADIAQE